MKSLSIDLDKFGFVDREKKNGKTVIFRCGRDFLYYALTFYIPKRFGKDTLCPEKIEKNRLFGIRVPWWMMWSTLQFTRMPDFLRKNSISLSINTKSIKNYFDFMLAQIMPKKISVLEAISIVERNVDNNKVSGIDIGIGMFGLIDHVLFVYGYDEENLFVFDTHVLPKLEYEKQTKVGDNRFIMKIPKSIISKRWTHWGRVWEVSQIIN